MTPDERKQYVVRKLKVREGLKAEINKLSKDRAAFLQEEEKKQNKTGDASFEEAMRTVVREQSAKKGIDIPK